MATDTAVLPRTMTTPDATQHVWQVPLFLLAFVFFIVRALTCPGSVPYRQLAVAALIGWCATSLANSHFSTFVEGRLLFFWLGAMLATQTSVKPS